MTSTFFYYHTDDVTMLPVEYARKGGCHLFSALRVPPGNKLEALKGNRAGQHSIRINDQWRICFKWKDSDAHDVEIVDYH